VNILQV